MMEPGTKEKVVIKTVGEADSQISHQQSPADEEPQYPAGLRLFSILVPLGICTFLIALVTYSRLAAMSGI